MTNTKKEASQPTIKEVSYRVDLVLRGFESSIDRNVLRTILDPDKKYTVAEAQKALDAWKQKEVK